MEIIIPMGTKAYLKNLKKNVHKHFRISFPINLKEISAFAKMLLLYIYISGSIFFMLCVLTIKGSYILCIIHCVIFQNQKYVHKKQQQNVN